MNRHCLCTAEKEAIHSILDDIEAELFGNHSPYESIQALDEHCSSIFPGWNKSRVCQRPVAVPRPQDTETEIGPELETCSVHVIEREPGEPVNTPVEAEIDALKEDVKFLIDKIGGTLPERVPSKSNLRVAEEQAIPETPSQALIQKTRPGPRIIPTKANVRALEEELVMLQKEHMALKRQRRRVRKELDESQEKITQLKIRYWRSELIRKKMNKSFSTV